MKQKIVVVGASGAVGKTISKFLNKNNSYQLILSGRRVEPLAQLQKEFANDTSILQLDITKPSNFDFLKDAALLIMCVDIPDLKIPNACIENGVAYMDISASESVLMQLKTLNNIAFAKKVPLLFGVGLAPGLTNILAKHILHQNPSVKTLELYVILGLGEKHGDKAFQWTFDNLHKSYAILQNGQSTKVKSFTQGKSTDLLGMRKFYLFDFVDQHLLKGNTALKSISTRLAFDNRFFTGLVAFLRKLGLTAMYRNRGLQKVMMQLLQNVKLGSDVYGAKVVGEDENGNTHHASLYGYAEGEMTALVATYMVPYLLQTSQSGLIYSHDIITDIAQFLNDLQQSESYARLKVQL